MASDSDTTRATAARSSNAVTIVAITIGGRSAHPKAHITDMASANYTAKDITVLEGLEPVRLRPGMYIGSPGINGLHLLVYEIVANSVDEALAGRNDTGEFTILPDNSVTVRDRGAGIPVDEVEGTGMSALEVVLTKLRG